MHFTSLLPFLVAAALKATLWAAAWLGAAHALPPSQASARRSLCLLGVWGLGVVPWLSLDAASVGTAAAHPLVIALGTASTGYGWTILASLWAVGSCLAAARAWRQWRAIRWLMDDALPCARNVGALRIDVRTSNLIASPCIVGFWQATVLVPADAEQWSETQWLAALRHEQRHAEQHDAFHRIACAIVRVLWWWHPLALGVCGRYEVESELCCDNAALTACSGQAYGEMLLGLATDAILPVPTFAQRSTLRERLERLLNPQPTTRLSRAARWLLAGLCASGCVWLVLAVRSDLPDATLSEALRAEAVLRLSAQPFPQP